MGAAYRLILKTLLGNEAMYFMIDKLISVKGMSPLKIGH